MDVRFRTTFKKIRIFILTTLVKEKIDGKVDCAIWAAPNYSLRRNSLNSYFTRESIDYDGIYKVQAATKVILTRCPWEG